MDYRRLHREGIRHIERLGSRLWTDFNIHDPGITILDVLCYAITDLSYRTNFDLPDLLSHPSSRSLPAPTPQFYTAAEILFCNPVSVNDFRKVTIDVEGVKNAWLFKALEAEAQLYLQESTVGVGDLAIHLRPYENQPVYASVEKKDLDMASDAMKKTIDGISEAVVKPGLENLKVILKSAEVSNAILADSMVAIGKGDNAMALALANTWLLSTQDNVLIPLSKLTIEPKECSIDYQGTNKLQLNGLYNVLLELDDEIDPENAEAVEEIVADVRRRLHRYRNLCEDFLAIEVVENVPFGICANIVIERDADEEETLAQVFFNINRYLSPPLNFYSLEEMWAKKSSYRLTADGLALLAESGFPTDLQAALKSIQDIRFTGEAEFSAKATSLIGQHAHAELGALVLRFATVERDSDLIFDGPRLCNGFIDDEELEAAELRQQVFKSDIYQLIMDVPGVQSIQSLRIGKCHANQANDFATDPWCISFSSKCKPKLDYGCTKIRFTKGAGYLIPEIGRTIELLDRLTAEAAKPRIGLPQDIPIPQGENRELTDYTSIQEDFPLVYGVGSAGIPGVPTPERKAQAKQLKAYLTFFDQILGNYLAQLAQVGRLLSVSNTEERTRFSLPLDRVVPGAEYLLKDYQNGYRSLLEQIAETPSRRNRRQNELLDHLLARFGEQFNDYALALFKLTRQSDERLAYVDDPVETVFDKRALLKKIPTISSERGKAFDYKKRKSDAPEPDVWNSDNVEGVKKRVMTLLGLPDYNRKLLSCLPGFHSEVFQWRKTWKFRMFESENSGEWLLEGARSYREQENARKAADASAKASKHPENLSTPPNLVDEEFCIYLYEKKADEAQSEGLKPLAQSPAFDDLEEYEVWKKKLARLASPACEAEGFHIVEHILMRPQDDDYHLLRPDPCGCGDCTDPYSFWVTVVAPASWSRFDNEEMRYHFEQLLRSELPAHVAARICWLGSHDLLHFENSYHAWLWELAQADADPYALRDSANEMIDILNGLDCGCGKTELPKPPDCTPKSSAAAHVIKKY